MQIALVSVDALPLIGGISLYTHYLADALATLGDHRVVVIGPKGSHVPSGYQRSYCLIEDLESEVTAREGSGIDYEDRRIAEFIDPILEEHDIQKVILTHPFYYGKSVVDVAQRRMLETAVCAHGFEIRSQMVGHPAPDVDAILAQDRVTTLRDRLVYTLARCDSVLANSRYTAGVVTDIGVPTPVAVAGCGLARDVADREFDASGAADRQERIRRREELGLSPRPLIAFCGRLVRHKRADRLIDICAADPDLQVALIGGGPEQANLLAQADSAGVLDRVLFAGQVSEDSKWQILRAADFCALMSEPNDEKGQVEGFGIALLEGAAAGAVPVSSGTGGMVDVVEDDVTGLILPGDAASANAARLREVYADEERMARLCTAARDNITTTHNYARIAQDLLKAWNG